MLMLMRVLLNCSYDVVHVYLRDKCPEWIRNRHPTGGVPVLETDDGRVLYESVVCAQYADDANPQSRLTPTDPFIKAKHSILICEFDKVSECLWGWLIILKGRHGHLGIGLGIWLE